MRRKEKAISDPSGIDAVIEKAGVCRLGMVDGNSPYVVPLCFGYQDGVLYFHSALKGLKIDIIGSNPNVCVEFDVDAEPVDADKACDWSMKFKSVIGFGKAVLIDDPDEKRDALSIIMSHYSDQPFQFPENKLAATAVIKVKIDRMTGKQSGF